MQELVEHAQSKFFFLALDPQVHVPATCYPVDSSFQTIDGQIPNKIQIQIRHGLYVVLLGA
jgi:hypothetical protein